MKNVDFALQKAQTLIYSVRLFLSPIKMRPNHLHMKYTRIFSYILTPFSHLAF